MHNVGKWPNIMHETVNTRTQRSSKGFVIREMQTVFKI